MQYKSLPLICRRCGHNILHEDAYKSDEKEIVKRAQCGIRLTPEGREGVEKIIKLINFHFISFHHFISSFI